MMSATSLFLYGTLRHLPLLAVVLGREPDQVPARLPGHRVMRVAGETYPAIREAPGKSADGLLIEVTAAERARLDYYEGAYHYALQPVVVETAGGPRHAQVYFPTDAQPPADGPWSLDTWAVHHGDAVTLAAVEAMSLMGVYSAEEMRGRYPPILTRAHSRLRAGCAPVVSEVRQGPGAESVAVAEARQPYTANFAVAEYDLRFPRFSGGQSGQVTRAAFLMGDAVTVLPYDPVRDRVMLIEQFRFGPFMRGDPRPWSLEPVAGRIDPGETPEDAARRETEEEAGLKLSALHRVGAYYPSPGAVTEYLYSYVGIADLPDGIAGLGGVAGEEEDILGHVLPFDRLMEVIGSGEAGNGPLILTALWLAMNRGRLRGV